MSASELITPDHLSRKALIYIRVSSPNQVLTSKESLDLQYALRQRALNLGWPSHLIEVIDADLALTATSTRYRTGFQALAGKVALGEVGIILSREVTRLCRNCTDWYPLLDVCSYKSCLIGDEAGVYDPGSANGRLLLGVKGQLGEYELYTIRTRLRDGLLNKARRGELAVQLPVGLVRDESGQVHKDPNLEVQERIALVFATFLQVRTLSKVLSFFSTHHLELPRQDPYGGIIWKKPNTSSLITILHNPAYAGAFAYGKTHTVHTPNGGVRGTQKKLPFSEWKIVVEGVYPAYIDWPTYLEIQAQLRANYAEYNRERTRGVPRPGAALLQGLVYCGECGHKMIVQYKGWPRYICNHLRISYQLPGPSCQDLPAEQIDAAVIRAFFEALSPLELDAYSQTLKSQRALYEQLEKAHCHHLDRLRYEASLAQRQFNRVDPDNRLVAAALEKRWEEALTRLRQGEAEYERWQGDQGFEVEDLSTDLKAAFSSVCQRLPQLWENEVLDRVHRKALLRSLIDKVVLKKKSVEWLSVRIVWRGGAVTELEVAKRVKTLNQLEGGAEMERIIVERSQAGVSDEQIANELTALGYRSPMVLDRVLPNTVLWERVKRGIRLPRRRAYHAQLEGKLIVPQLAKALGKSSNWIYDRIHNGTIKVDKSEFGMYLFCDEEATLLAFQKLRDGELQALDYRKGYQHE